jgi:hypothetical protein
MHLSLALIAAMAVSGSASAAEPGPTPTPIPMVKISGTMTCSRAERMTMDIRDATPDHTLSLGKSECEWTTPLRLGSFRTRKGDSKSLSDSRGDVSMDHGYHVGSMTNGDRYYVKFDGDTRFDARGPQAQRGHWSFTGGTGKLTGLQGRGTYKTVYDAQGEATVTVEGEYRLPEGAAAADPKPSPAQ